MDLQDAREINRLLFDFVGLFHEKIILSYRKIDSDYPGLKKNHYKIMGMLSQSEFLLPSEIGRRLDIEKGSVTTLIDQLEERGLVLRIIDPGDRRKSKICLSQSGREFMMQVDEKHARVLKELLMISDGTEIISFINNLRCAVDFMEKI